MTDAERREAARQFIQKWNGKGKEDEDDRSYWIDLLSRVMGLENVTDHIEFQKKVIVDGNTKRIDAYIPETRVLIEQKTLGIALDKPIHQSGDIDLTPYEQAKRYNDNLPFDEKARWIVTSNFAEVWVYDMNMKVPAPEKISLTDLREQYSRLDFLISKETTKISQEMKVSLQAGELVGAIYDAFLKQYKDPENPESLKSLNKLCVRIVFCLYAEDAGIFGVKNLFHDYLSQYDAKSARKALVNLFKVLDQKPEDRDAYLADDEPVLAEFPYVNGGLFADEEIEIPPLTDEIFNLILNNASGDFNWSQISPTIFGAVFESTLNPETRRSGGMHYTSIENIHKVIDPLFLNDLKAELNEIKAIDVLKTKDKRLAEYQKKLAGLKFLDPACGSGNFLTETYISIRRLENEVIAELNRGQVMLGTKDMNPIQVDIGQFYGIEINDFAVTVAKTALWIAESQMMKETEDVVKMSLDFLPLKTNAYIVEGNALRIDWESVVSKNQLNYIMGNPPFVGSSIKGTAEAQKADRELIFGESKAAGKLDYVACWYKKAFEYIQLTPIEVAFVSTNSITQGEQVRPMWEKMLSSGLYINFAYRTFQWDSEANLKAHVHCVIISVSMMERRNKFIDIDGTCKSVSHINGYLIDAPDFYIESRGSAPKWLPKLTQGNKPWDDGGLILSREEKEDILAKYPQLECCIKEYVGSKDFINNIKRFCLWMIGVSPNVYRNIPEIKERLKIVSNIRLASPTIAVQKQAETPSVFSQIRQPDSDYILIPETSSSTRRYIPMGFMSKDVIASNSVMTAANADLYLFGVLESNVHMSWVRTLCGRMKSDYRYSPALYNNFPWPEASDNQRSKIEQTAQGILDARALYPECSLADLYDPLTMPVELKKAHIANDKAVMEAYGLNVKTTSEADCVAHLMKMYQELTK